MIPSQSRIPPTPVNGVRPPLTLQVGGNDSLGAQRNVLLSSLPNTVWQRLQVHMEAVDLPLGKELCEPNGRISHVVFPTTAVVSLLSLTSDGATSEVAVVGNMGMVGTWLLLGFTTSHTRAVVQCAGRGLRVRVNHLLDEFDHSPALRTLLLRYVHVLFTQIAQTAACNCHHSLEQRLCHRLMLLLDRIESNRLEVTHEVIANMLGVRREGVTVAVGRLTRAGIIANRRGSIDVLDRLGLEARSCECYGVVRAEYARLLPQELAS